MIIGHLQRNPSLYISISQEDQEDYLLLGENWGEARDDKMVGEMMEREEAREEARGMFLMSSNDIRTETAKDENLDEGFSQGTWLMRSN